ncbi:hypothetical protein BJF79_24900 [Actinomadura sp. CNU-125]|nr:hypothetical protein BJF79_24900 [Actinomadura sp. CNU-125]
MSTASPRFLDGVRVVELGGIGPVPHAGMLLASLGADVVRVERTGAEPDERAWDATRRGRTVVPADLKSPADVRRVRELAAAADVLVEGFRPGVAERMGLGPGELRPLNPGLVYARMTGWGQHGPGPVAPGTTSTTSGSPARCTPSATSGRRPRSTSSATSAADPSTWSSASCPPWSGAAAPARAASSTRRSSTGPAA